MTDLRDKQNAILAECATEMRSRGTSPAPGAPMTTPNPEDLRKLAQRVSSLEMFVPFNTAESILERNAIASDLTDLASRIEAPPGSTGSGVELPKRVRIFDPDKAPAVCTIDDAIAYADARVAAERLRAESAERERDALSETLASVIADTAKVLGCEPDNEAILQAIGKLRKDAERWREFRGAGSGITQRLHYSAPSNRNAIIDAAIAAERGENAN